MGCDMYVSVEVLVDGVWQYVPGEFYDGRRNVLFGLLADVRNDEGLTPLRPRRLIPNEAGPDQISFRTYAMLYTKSLPDNRIKTWYTLMELEEFDWEAFGLEWNERDFSVVTMGKLRELANGHPENVRIILWFDDEVDDPEMTAAEAAAFQ